MRAQSNKNEKPRNDGITNNENETEKKKKKQDEATPGTFKNFIPVPFTLHYYYYASDCSPLT